ncbi:LysR family transcriptional regulator [Phenylobacterium sp.]|uniref:LysR family transcriptional regulator n=1 Tax=Phenylobacterium sp. TaxID=1871053 RepID=UPI00286CC1AE|nr:LysR family transcriptional regulator [Phenylobacterium sp.]
MSRGHLPLNALRAFEASARHLSFTRAGLELSVTQAAVSHQVKGLEERLGVALFRRLPRGLALTDEGVFLLPVLRDSFDRVGEVMARFEAGRVREVLTVGVVGTFAVGWLLPRLAAFHEAHPFIDLRIATNNNRVDLAGEGLDCAIRFGDGAWHGTEAVRLAPAPLTPLCDPATAERLEGPASLAAETLLRSYRADDWPAWFAAAGLPCPPIRGPVFDSSFVMAEAAAQGLGVALAPASMFERDLASGRLVAPFILASGFGHYWLSWLKSKEPTTTMRAFEGWLGASLSSGVGS